MKGKVLPFRCVLYEDSKVFINLKAQRPSQLLGMAILDKVKTDSNGNPVSTSVRKGEAKIRNLSREGLTALRNWRQAKVLDMLSKNEWILEVKSYRYAPGRLDSHFRLCWRLIAYPSKLTPEQLDDLDSKGLQGAIQVALL
ncbi:hypothetical protein M6D76_08610 [Alcaligenes faecalis]|uniref:hypothetical protein n=1 Tax=Alcaligenes faecalis TaxID=511 RepID=UPI00211C635D|nr:hypothetical protein [Alcaligenes faecalis]UUO12722.1 hypothetical protein M6D76_08610 [Alcaligenes faecalis]